MKICRHPSGAIIAEGSYRDTDPYTLRLVDSPVSETIFVYVATAIEQEVLLIVWQGAMKEAGIWVCDQVWNFSVIDGIDLL
jgi:hypothetical protein